MAADEFSEVMGERRGASRPVAEFKNVPRVFLQSGPGDGWHAQLMREHNELHLNVDELGLSARDDRGRELISDVGALLVAKLQANPGMSDDELDELAVYGVELFRVMPLEERARRNLPN